MNFKFNRTIVMLIVLVFVISGCGNSSVDPVEDIKEVVGEGKSNENPDVSPTEDVEISVLTAMAYGTERLDVLVANYMKENPHVTIDMQHAPNDNKVVVKSRINAGDFPDILVAQTGTDVAAYYEQAYDFTGDPVLDKFQPDAIELSKSSDGRVLSLPWTYESMAIIYNKDLFEKAGIVTLPRTLSELEEASKTLEANGILPFANGMKETWVLSHIAAQFMSVEDDSPQVIIDRISNGDLSFSEMKAFKNIFGLLDLMLKYGPEKPFEVGWELSENMLANGEAAMIHMGDWAEATMVGFNPDVNMGFLPLPVSENPEDAVVMSSISWQFLVNKDSKSVEETKKFLEYMLTSDDGIDWMTQTVGAVPTTITDVRPAGMLASSAKESIDAGITKPWNHILWPAGFNDEMGTSLQSYMFGASSEDEIMQLLTNSWLDRVE